MLRLIHQIALVVILTSSVGAAILRDTPIVLNSGETNEWTEFAGKPAQRAPFEIIFAAEANSQEHALFIRQYDVRYQWRASINGRLLGTLLQIDQAAVQLFAIPPGTLVNGTNTLLIQAPIEAEQIEIGPIEYVAESTRALLAESAVEVQLTESGRAVPGRVTIVDAFGALVPIAAASSANSAVRPGTFYTADGTAKFTLRAGKYTLHASRGPEYSAATVPILPLSGGFTDAKLTLTRQVNTRGWIAADTHIHTYTHSRHGDATIAERVVTIAGEAIELPIATDHNLHVSFDDAAAAADVRRFFTPVVGNEVTTRRGHFNAFPIISESRVPDFRIEDWSRLIPAIRGTPNVQFVIMNHPTDLHAGFRPFASTNFNPVTGENLHQQDYGMDAIELINSAALQSNQRQVFSNWFALLNSGRRIVGVGASDSHEVARFVVGQGRTYIRADDRDAGRIDVNGAVQSLKAGRAVASMGLIVNPTINGRFGIGDLVTNSSTLELSIDAQGPAWAPANRIEVYGNGQLFADVALPKPNGAGSKGQLTIRLPQPKHDMWLVVIASGEGQVGPFWALPKPYQATSAEWRPELFAVANPIWIDGDRDGRFASAREYAERIVGNDADVARIIARANTFGRAIAAHVASLLHKRQVNLRSPEVKTALASAPQAVQNGFNDYLQTLPNP